MALVDSKDSTSAGFACNKEQPVGRCFAPTDVELAEVLGEELFDVVCQSTVVAQ